LTAAAIHDHGYAPGAQQSPLYPGAPLAGPVPNIYGHYGSPPPNPSAYGAPLPPVQQASGLSFAPPPTGTSSLSPTTTHENRHPSIAEQNYVPHQTDTQSPAQTPGTQFYNQIPQPHQPLTHIQPQYADYLSSKPQQPPEGGYSQYQYKPSQPQQQQQRPGSNPYDVHNQVYRPTEDEHRPHGNKASASSGSGKPSRFDSGTERVEKGVGRFFKKLEKRIG